MSQDIVLYSPFPPEECVQRLMSVIDYERRRTWSFESWFGIRPVIGYVDATTLRLRRRGGRDSSGMWLKANLQPSGTGTRITGECRPLPWYIFGFWFVIGSVAALYWRADTQLPWLFLIGAVVPILVICRSYNDRAFLFGFLRTTIKATADKPAA